MTEILAITAFLIAFGTVFLVNDALRKTERKHEAAIKGAIDKLKEELDQNFQTVREMQDDVEELKDTVKTNTDKSVEMKKRLGELDDKLFEASNELENLSTAINPKSRRTPRKSA
jgi:Mg2+ and Co2+ transporter CorA